MHRLAFALVLLVCIGLHPVPASGQARDWMADVRILADDSLEGRDAGSEGYRKAAAYVARQFELAGLRAVADRPTRPAWRRDSFFQRFAGAGTS